MTNGDDRMQRLRDAGLIPAGELPPEYEAVVAGLTPDEIDVLIDVRRRLDEAGRASGVEPGDAGIAL